MKWWMYILLIGFPLIGGLIGFYTNIQKQNQLKILLSFAGAYLLSVVLFHLIPHLYTEFNVVSGILILSGFFFQVYLEKFSRGVEHGHLHIHQQSSKSNYIPYEILISLSLHSFMEGMPLGSGLLENSNGQLSFLFGIVSHEMPAAFAMVSILKAAKLSNSKLLLFVVVYSSMSTTGVVMSSLLKDSVPHSMFEYLMAFVVGTFLHIATTILFESSENHKFNMVKVLAMLAGIGLAALVSL
ncbi:MAG: ZIP family metal transporter [Bacteroidia bacterium]|jgi:zinc transporter ZupT|nr:ZIP family metal transporter [Bacteroidia bacterium]